MMLGCSPYIQIFKAGKLILTAASANKYSQEKEELPFCLPSDGSITFPIEQVLQGDVLVRCRHLATNGKRMSMFRAAFHTGYTPPKVMRLSKAQLDGACNDSRFSDDFFIDLVFEACDADTASKHLLSLTVATTAPGEKERIVSNEKNCDVSDKNFASLTSCNEAELRRARATVTICSSDVVSASTYDTMLHRDSRFWDVIAERRSSRRQSMDSGSLSRYGPTIGRRRNSSTLKMYRKNIDSSSTKLFDENDTSHNSAAGDTVMEGEQLENIERRKKLQKAHSIRRTIDTFTIGGGDIDLPSNPSAPEQSQRKKKDELMEALMALEDDIIQSRYEDDEESVIFNENENESSDKAEGNEALLSVDHCAEKQDENGHLEGTSSAVRFFSDDDVLPKEKVVKDDDSADKLPNQASGYTGAVIDDYINEIDAMVDESTGEDVLIFDENDDDLEDLENFLTKSGK